LGPPMMVPSYSRVLYIGDLIKFAAPVFFMSTKDR
jgi:hypothetical protein